MEPIESGSPDHRDRDTADGAGSPGDEPSEPSAPTSAITSARIVILGAVVIASMVTLVIVGRHHAPRPVIEVNPTPTVTVSVRPRVTIEVPAGTERRPFVVRPTATATATPRPTPRPSPTRPPPPRPTPSPSCTLLIMGRCLPVAATSHMPVVPRG